MCLLSLPIWRKSRRNGGANSCVIDKCLQVDLWRDITLFPVHMIRNGNDLTHATFSYENVMQHGLILAEFLDQLR
ncbi:hypothetical protein PCA31118_05371 [Pandoraea captiosa]|uniref:Uncharacterized protein n=1 Tax=Pandoraea captiosa TaxID=2508302 RepID=A0A5E5ATL3_9BURK|nr:hypothetical protein PCA31118_05371 [Pandoraea captiosa]